MRRIVVLFACWACMAEGLGVQAPLEPAESMNEVIIRRFSGRRGDKATLSPLQALTLMFQALHPAAAFTTSSAAALHPLGSHSLADPRLLTPAMSMNDDVRLRMPLTRADLLRAIAALPALQTLPAAVSAEEPRRAYQPSIEGRGYGKSEMDDPDFVKLPTGLRYKDAKTGTGKTPEEGDRVVVDWSGYTIGYFGRPFETKQLRQIDNIQDPFLRFEIGKGTVIPALEQGVIGMTEGGIRQLVVPGGPEGRNIGYPTTDPSHEKVGPKPSTFSGQRALDFVLENKGLIDKTLLFNIKLIRVDKKGTSKPGSV